MRTKYMVLVIIAAAFVVSSCSTHRTVVYSSSSPKVTKAGGPPPHAPAHGYRHKHPRGVVLVYDSKLEVYVVQDYPRHYYHADHFYRCEKDVWQVSASIEGPWCVESTKRIPPGLRKEPKEGKKSKKTKKGGGHGGN